MGDSGYGIPASAWSEALSPRQERVARRLATQLGPGPAAFFGDACRLVAGGPVLHSVTHLAAHLMREIEGSLLQVLEPVSLQGRNQVDGHMAKIRAILTELGIFHDDLIAEYWLGFAGPGNADNLATRAHRDGLDKPRPFGDEFVVYFDKFEQVLDVVLERLETNYFEIFGRLEKLLAQPSPGIDDAATLRQRFPRTEAVSQYFFGKASAAWVTPLHRQGFFQSPPRVELDEDAGTVQFPAWPPSQFLARVASDAPDAVVEAARTITVTDNVRVNHDLVEIAAALPAANSATLVPQLMTALGSRYGLMIPQRVGVVMGQLCAGGQTGPALDLAAALLKGLIIGYGPAAVVHGYSYGIILRDHIPSLVTTAGLPALSLLCTALDKIARKNPIPAGRDSTDDLSLLWRPSIDNRGNVSDTDLRHSLVDAVRDAGLALADENIASVVEIVCELESHPLLIFRRLSLRLLSRYPGQAPTLIAERLTDAAIIGNWRLDGEYLLLARSGAAGLSASDLRRLLTLIDEGPAPIQAEPSAGEEDTDPRAGERAARWRRNRLAAIQSVLPPGWHARYQALVTEFGPAPDPDTPMFAVSASWGDRSPVTAGELAAMPTAALVAFLKAGIHLGRAGQVISPESVRGVLGSAIQQDAEHRSADAASFIGLHPEYIGAVINGLWQSARNGSIPDWDGIIALADWINEQASEELTSSASGDLREWREPRADMLRLLITGLNLEPSPLRRDHTATIWAIIQDCCSDPDPTTEQEAEPPPLPDSPYMSLALTTVRAQAVHAAISYGLRRRRLAPNADLADIQEVLSRHLDTSTEQSLAVRTIYGQLFPQLVWMDERWAARHIDTIFTKEPAEEALLAAGWDAYLTAVGPSEAAWPMLADTYSMMTSRMDLSAGEQGENFPATQLGRHLLAQFWSGNVSLDEYDGILRRFYDRAAPDVASRVMWWISAVLSNLDNPDQAVITRLTWLWEYRVADVKNKRTDATELKAFGRWFASRHFTAGWSLQQLLTVLRITNDVESEDAVLAYLGELAADHTQPCLAVLEKLITVTRQPWVLIQHLDSIRHIIAIGMTGSPTAIDTSKRIRSLLLRDHVISINE